jgi:hypothetical protein
MGGRTGIRGYTYQTIISVIQSLQSTLWDTVQIEPDTPNEKVDLVFETDGQQRCQQVKSSINNFSKPDIIRWLEEVIVDVPSAGRYDLVLIGNVSADTNAWIKQLNAGSPVEVTSAKVKPVINRVTIRLLPFDQDMMENNVCFEVSKFLASKDLHLKHDSDYLIAMGLIYQFFQFSIIGKKVTKQELEESLLKWARSSYPKEFEETKQSKLQLHFYKNQSRSFVDEFTLKQINSFSPLLTAQRNAAHKVYFEAKAITVPPRTISALETPNNPFSILTGSSLMLSDAKPSEISESRKTFIREQLQYWFGIELNSDFFQLGNLKEAWMFGLHMETKYSGTTEEVTKRKLLNSLYWELQALQEVKIFADFWQQHYVIPLTITNVGKSFDEEITVDLQLPLSVIIAEPFTIPYPNDYDVLEKIINEEMMKTALVISADSLVEEYDNRWTVDSMLYRDLDLIYRLRSASDQLANKKAQLKRVVENLMDFEIYRDNPDVTILRFRFKSLSPNIHQAFPSLLLVQANGSFKIDYTITSKHSEKVHSGNLQCLIPEKGKQ